MREVVNDPYALKRLQMENEELKESLKLEEEKYNIACGLLHTCFQLNEEPIKEITNMYKSFHELRQGLKDICGEVVKLAEVRKALEEENKSLKERLQESSRLEVVVTDYEEKMFILTRGQDWEKAVAQDVLKRYRVSAQILCLGIKGCTAKEIIRRLYEGGGISVTTRRVNSALSVKEEKDLLRIRAVFHQFPDAFREYGISEEDMMSWFSQARIKKLKLISKNEAEKCFGRDFLEGMKPDSYVMGEFYDVGGMEDSEENCKND